MPLISERLGDVKHLDLTTWDTEFLKSISFLTQMFTSFNFPSRSGSSDLTLNQHDKYKGYSWKIEKE